MSFNSSRFSESSKRVSIGHGTGRVANNSNNNKRPFAVSFDKSTKPLDAAEPTTKRPSVCKVCDKCQKDIVAASLKREVFCSDCNGKCVACATCAKKDDKFVCAPCQKDSSLALATPVHCETCNFECRRIYWKLTGASGDHRFCSLCSKNPDAFNSSIVRNLPPPSPPTPTPTPLPNLKVTIANPATDAPASQFEKDVLQKLQENAQKLDALADKKLTASPDHIVANKGAKFTITDKSNLKDEVEFIADYEN